MIKKIEMENFYSIKEKVVLDFRATKSEKNLEENKFKVGKDELLKSIVIYGANASGKTNIIKAVDLAIAIILKSHNYIDNGITYQPFKFEKKYLNKESKFKINFFIENIEYEYFFSWKENGVEKEYLNYFPFNKKVEVFNRNKQDIKYNIKFKTHLKKLENRTRPDQLYLSKTYDENFEISKDIINFFKEKYILVLNDKKFISNLLEDEVNKKNFIKYFKKADLLIDNFEIKKIGENKLEQNGTILMKGDLFEFKILKKNKEGEAISFNLDLEESLGTQEYFKLLIVILDIIKNNKIVFIDEQYLNSLHSDLLKFILDLVHKSGSNCQVLFNTHNTNLLSNEIFRKEQIYFTEIKKDISTDLYSLKDIEDIKRYDFDYEKSYKVGRFGAVPNIDNRIGDDLKK